MSDTSSVVPKNVQTFGIMQDNSKSVLTDRNFHIDESEGLGAFLSIIILGGDKIGPINVDVGGGNLDYNSGILEQFFGINNFVYDPYSERPGQKGLEEQELFDQHKYIIEQIKGSSDTATSFSILNVIVNENDGKFEFDKEKAKDHIKLCLSCLQRNGFLYIKVYEGDKSNVVKGGYTDADGYHFSQTNFVFNNPEYISLIEEICNEGGKGKNGKGIFWNYELNEKYKYYLIKRVGNKVLGGKTNKKDKINLKNKFKKTKKSKINK